MKISSKNLKVKDLVLDLNNYRTVPQSSESDMINAMIAVKPDRFYAVLESLLSDGYLPTENIVALQTGDKNVVKEGNRRVGALKILHGLCPLGTLSIAIPFDIKEKINNVSDTWKKDNSVIPCVVYPEAERNAVDKIVSLTHGKGEKAQRDDWTSVARARHNREENNRSELGLDLLEKYLVQGLNLNGNQKLLWAGDYPLTVLDETLTKLPNRLNLTSKEELVNLYPNIPQRNDVEKLLLEIGGGNFGFQQLRSKESPDSLERCYKLAIPITPPTTSDPSSVTHSSGDSASSGKGTSSDESSSSSGASSSASGTSSSISSSTPSVRSSSKTQQINTQAHARKLLRKLTPKGLEGAKVLMLKNEMLSLDIKKNPLAFCFLLRACFEVSAKKYCSENQIRQKNNNGMDLTLLELLKAAYDRIINNDSKHPKVKILYSAMSELVKPHGVLSALSMNQLIHNPHFVISENDACIAFHNLYPLLEELN